MMIDGVNTQSVQFDSSVRPPPPPGGAGGPSFDNVLSTFDSDSDGGLSIDELSISEEAFALADANEDGVVDRAEFESGGAQAIGDDLKAQGTMPPRPPAGFSGEARGASAYQSTQDLLYESLANGDEDESTGYDSLLSYGLDLTA